MARTLIVTTSYAFVDTGRDAAGGFVASFAEALSATDAVAVAAPTSADTAAPSRDSSVTVFPFEVPRLPLSLLRPTHPGDWRAIARTLSTGKRAVLEAADAFEAERILALWVLPSGHWARAAARRRSVPYYNWALGSDIWSLGRVPGVRRVLGGVLTDATANFADGYALGADVERLAGTRCAFLPSSRALPAPLTSRESEHRPGLTIAYLGRWHPNKGIDLLLEALALIGADAWKAIAEVRIAGGGPLESLVREKVAALVSSGRPVTVTGFLSATEAAQFLAASDLLVIPSRVESIPVVFSDAMAAGLPVVATPVGDLPRLVADYGVGIVAETTNPDALAAALEAALDMDSRAFRANTAKARLDFSPEGAARRFVELTAG